MFDMNPFFVSSPLRCLDSVSFCLQRVYQNLQQEAAEVDVCEEPKCCECPCDQSCDHEEEEQALIKTNNYQFC